MPCRSKTRFPFLSIKRTLAILLLIFLISFPEKGWTQTRAECNTITPDMGYTIHSVVIKARWISKTLQQRTEELAGIGKEYDPQKIEAAKKMLENELLENEEGLFAVQLVGSTSVLYITSTLCDVSDLLNPRQAKLTIYPYYIRLNLYDVGEHILPTVRTSKPTFYSHVPAFLLATSPYFGFTQDRQNGQTLSLQTSTDLLHLPGAMKANTDAKKMNLLFALNGSKSIFNSFYSAGAGLKLEHPVYRDSGIGWSLGVQYTAESLPTGNSRFTSNSFRIHAGITGKLNSAFIQNYAISGSTFFQQNKIDSFKSNRSGISENGYAFHLVGDGAKGLGFSRIGLWFQAGSPKLNGKKESYQRILLKGGYAMALGKTHNVAELELNYGFGYIWGNAPLYNQFYAGNTLANFLYMPLRSEKFQSFPDGAVIRSLGVREGGFKNAQSLSTGGTAH